MAKKKKVVLEKVNNVVAPKVKKTRKKRVDKKKVAASATLSSLLTAFQKSCGKTLKDTLDLDGFSSWLDTLRDSGLELPKVIKS